MALRRLRYLGQIAFCASLSPAVAPHVGSLSEATRSAFADVCKDLSSPATSAVDSFFDVAIAAGLATDLARTLFNLIRLEPPDSSSLASRALMDSILTSLCDLLRCSSTEAAVTEAKADSLQLAVVIPKELACPALSSEWKPIAGLLLDRLKAAEEDTSESNGPIMPALVLQYLAESEPALREAIKCFVIPKEYLDAPIDPDDPYRPAGQARGWDPNDKLPLDAPLRIRMIKALTSINYNLKRVVGDCLLALFAGDAQEFTRICGLGSAAGVLQERDLLGSFQHLSAG